MSVGDVIVVDQFCGGGGATEGMEQAATKLGVPVRVYGINHWDCAIETYSRNHPTAKPLCNDVELTSPRLLVPGGRADVLLSGFECTYFSTARGAKPVNDQGRMGAWQVPDWAHELGVRYVLAENVPEFVHFGPLCTLPKGHAGPHVHHDGEDTAGRCEKTVRSRRGEYFAAWLKAWTDLGYRYEWRVINAADHDAVTTRRRWFFKARRDGGRITWPRPTRARTVRGDLFDGPPRWRPALDVLDLGDVGRSIFGRKHPLKPNTLLRIARGLLLFCGPLGPYYVNLLDLTPAQLAKLPPTRASAWSPFVVGNRTNNAPRDLGQPIPTATTTTGGGVLLVQPFLLSQASGGVARSAQEPTPTIPTTGALQLVQPFLIGQRDSWDGRQCVPGRPRDVAAEPIQTVTAEAAIGLVRPFLSPYYGNSQPDSVDEPLSTLTTKPRHGLVSPIVVPYGPRADVRSAEQPLHTILAKERLGLAQPFIVPYRGEREGQAPRVHSAAEPFPTVTSEIGGALVVPGLVPGRVDGVDPRRLIWIGEDLHLLDIYYRMLRNHELAAAMGFPRHYSFAGKSRDVTRQIGNAWEVNLAEALATTVLEDLVDQPSEAAA